MSIKEKNSVNAKGLGLWCLMLRVMVLNATFNNISAFSFIG
jgi:hypothetical protein